MKTVLLFVLPLFVLGCSESNTKTHSFESNSPNATEQISKLDSLAHKILLTFPPLDFPKGPTYIVGNFCHHGDEFDKTLAEEKWMGLYLDEKKNTYALNPVEAKLNYCNDPIFDGNEEASGRKLITQDQSQPLFFIAKRVFLKSGPCANLLPLREGIKLNQPKHFRIDTSEYTLFAKGKWVEEENNYRYIANFEIHFMGKGIDQIIYREERLNDIFDEGFVFEFVGDLDGDAIPDFIFDTEAHYNVNGLTLFLSRPADEGQLVKQVAFHRTTGC